ncbi:hypothetical protein VTI74DRAFT_9598 [Chaetomium olivicolor]
MAVVGWVVDVGRAVVVDEVVVVVFVVVGVAVKGEMVVVEEAVGEKGGTEEELARGTGIGGMGIGGR